MIDSIAAMIEQRLHLIESRIEVFVMSSIAANLPALTKGGPGHGVQFFRKIHQSYGQTKSSEMHRQEIARLRKHAFEQCPIRLSCRHEDRALQTKLFASYTIECRLQIEALG